MKISMGEFIWLSCCVLTLALLPWWMAVVASSASAGFLLQFKDKGFRRRVVLLFSLLTLVMLAFHVLHKALAVAVSGLFKLPHYSLLAMMGAGIFSTVLALAAEAVLLVKHAIGKSSDRITSKNDTPQTSIDFGERPQQ